MTSTRMPARGSMPEVSFVIVNFHSAAMVAQAVASIERWTARPFEIVVVDNSESADELRRLDDALGARVRLIAAPRNGGFGAGCNQGAKVSRAPWLFFLNPDARLASDCVAALMVAAEGDCRIGVLGACVRDEAGAVPVPEPFVGIGRSVRWIKSSLARRLPSLLPPRRAPLDPRDGILDSDYVIGAAMMMRRRLFESLGGFDESFFMYAEETDLQYRMRHVTGLRAVLVGAALVDHVGGGTIASTVRRRILLERGCVRFVAKHRSPPYRMAYKVLTVAAIALETALGARPAASTTADQWALAREVMRA